MGIKFFHLGDLHIGKKVNGFSMIDDQRFILNQIIDMAVEKSIDFILISGDLYDRTVPNIEAIALADEFLTRLINRGIKVYVISGNHDSADRLSFASKIVENSGLYIYSKFDGNVHYYDFDDNIRIYMLPFVRPVDVRRFYEDKNIDSYDSACRAVIDGIDLDSSKFNIIMAHQFLLGADICESEEVFIGSLYSVNADIFKEFDYVALGHLHGPQKVGGREECRYSGSILKYSFSEVNHKKSIPSCEVIIADNVKKIEIEKIPLKPIRDMIQLKGKLREIEGSYKTLDLCQDYVRVILTEDDDIAALDKLREIFPNLMKLEYDNKRTRESRNYEISVDAVKKNPADMFAELYAVQNGEELSIEQLNYINSLVEKIWEEEHEN